MNLVNEKVELSMHLIRGTRSIFLAFLICFLLNLTFAYNSTFVFGKTATIEYSYEKTRPRDCLYKQSYSSTLIIPSTYYAPRSNISFFTRVSDAPIPQRINVSIVTTNLGTIDGTTWVDGSFGKALSFNGFDSQVVINSSATFDFKKAMTVEAWIKPNIVDSWEQASVVSDFNPRQYKWKIGLTKFGSLRFDVYSNQINSCAVYGGSLTVNKWYHIAGTFDGAYVRIFLDGVRIAEKEWSLSLQNNSKKIYIGFEPVNERHFDGIIDEVRLYNRTLTEAEIAYSYSNKIPLNTLGLVAWWRMDEGAETHVYTHTPQLMSNDTFHTVVTVYGVTSRGWFNGTITTPDYEGTYMIRVTSSNNTLYKILKVSRLYPTMVVNSKLNLANETFTISGEVYYNDGSRVPDGEIFINGNPARVTEGSWTLKLKQPSLGKKVYQVTSGSDKDGVNVLFSRPILTVYFYSNVNNIDRTKIDLYFIATEIILVSLMFWSVSYRKSKPNQSTKRFRILVSYPFRVSVI